MIKRSRNQILNDAITYLRANTAITNLNAGSVARSLLEAMHWEYNDLYNYAEFILNQSSITQATGEYLERLGALFGYARRNEMQFNLTTNRYESVPISDDLYRAEITQQVIKMEKANLTSIRLAALSISGVSDVQIDEFLFGPGSLRIMIFVDNGFSESSVLSQVKDVVDTIKAAGIKIVYATPVKRTVNLTIGLLISSSASNAERQQINYRVRQAIIGYFNELGAGKGLIANELTQRIMEVSTLIQDFKVNQLLIDMISFSYANVVIEADERLVLGALLLE